MTEPKALSEHNESQTQLLVNNQKSPQLPPPSKSFKTPSPSFVSKIPIPARLVKERSPSTSPTGLLGFKSPLPEQKEHWRQHRPLSSPTLSNSSGEESPLSKKQSSNKVDASADDINDTTDDEETNISKNDTSPTAIGTKEGTSVDTTSDSYLPTDANDENSYSLNQESVQPISENKEGEEGDTYPKGGLKVRFDDNSPEKIASYWDSIAEPINKTPNTTPFYKSPLANTVNFDESTTENEDSVFMEEISYVSDSDDIRTYRPSFLDETSFMSEIEHSNTSTATMDKEATVQKFFAGLSESEFTIYESSQFDSSIRADKQSDISINSQLEEEAHSSYSSTEDPQVVEPKNLIRLEQTNSTMNIESSEEDHRDSEDNRESHQIPTHSEESIKPNVLEPSELKVANSIVEVENAGVADEASQSGTIKPESSENNEESYSEVANQSLEIRRQTGESSEISETEQTVPVRAESPEDAEQTVPGQVINTNSLGHPNKSYADAVSSSLKQDPNEDEPKMESTPQLEPSTIEDTMDNSWPLKFPLPNTPFGQEASTQIDNDSGNCPEYHSEITWNYNESLDRRDELSQGPNVSDVNEAESNALDAVVDSDQTGLFEDESSMKNSSIVESHTQSIETPSFSSVETPQKLLKQSSSRQVSSAPPPANIEEFNHSESELPMSAKAIRELTPMKLLQSLSRMTSPSESIKSLNERFKDSDISVTEFDDSLLTSDRKFNSTDDNETSEEESRSKVDFEQSRVYSEYDESSLLDQSGAQHDNHKFGQSETEEHDEQSFGGSQPEEAGLSTEDFLYEDMVQAINNLKEIMSELRDGQGVHRNLGNALEANLNELTDKTQKRDSLLVEMEAMKEIVDQTNNEMSELKSQLEKRVRSEEEVDAKLADMTEVTDKLRHRIKNKAEQIVHPTGRGFVGSLPSFLLNTLILLGVFAALELFFVGVLLRTHEQYDAVFGTMSHGTYYSPDLEHNQSWSVYFARNVWEILVNIFHGNTKGLSVPS